MFIDSHCHLDKIDLSPYSGQFSEAVCAAHARQVNEMLCVSIDKEHFPSMYQLIADQPTIHASFGIHPCHVEKAEDVLSEAELTKWVKDHSKVVALGESGLDYYYTKDTSELQKESFANHLRVADQLALPVIVHTRDAREDTLALIKKHGGESGGVLHCFTESLAMAQAAIEMNYLISFSGIVTFKNAQELKEVVKAIPLEKILIETDSPYLAPIPYRGKKNEPKYVVEVAQCVADLKGVSIEEVAEVTSANFHRLFGQARSS
ncbi:TatD family hydrolase [Neptunomonas phycophila]|uniref:TatD family hydrolase n=1 Tax=Neptunomonas phycophila TaxID=1572645 RepID=UPI001BE8205A|nr:TatD family hydrolase [Neptunomonas phycophila]MBT3146172.1 TatD family hydrolase [Neptunomonas phycophila]